MRRANRRHRLTRAGPCGQTREHKPTPGCRGRERHTAPHLAARRRRGPRGSSPGGSPAPRTSRPGPPGRAQELELVAHHTTPDTEGKGYPSFLDLLFRRRRLFSVRPYRSATCLYPLHEFRAEVIAEIAYSLVKPNGNILVAERCNSNTSSNAHRLTCFPIFAYNGSV